ncbi:hypothetical protein VNO77_19554 [Canavalia gladiata]|uniref:Uncharacterized protein n=1 Tax=Canavalia gladiata TaxID=3824 RepID=A0AAN9LMQ3_CANGL
MVVVVGSRRSWRLTEREKVAIVENLDLPNNTISLLFKDFPTKFSLPCLHINGAFQLHYLFCVPSWFFPSPCFCDWFYWSICNILFFKCT